MAPALPASKQGKKPRAKGAGKAKAPPTTGDAAESAVSSVVHAVSSGLDVAGELLLDGDNTPVAASEVVGQNVDVPALKASASKGKRKAKSAAAATGERAREVAEEAGKQVEAARKRVNNNSAKAIKGAEKAVEEKTGVDVEAAVVQTERSAKRAKTKASEIAAAVEPEVEKVIKAAKPLKGKAKKSAQAVAAAADGVIADATDAATNPKKRKVAADFIDAAFQGGKQMAGDVVATVQQVVAGVVQEFGEASGLAKDLGNAGSAGKKGTTKASKASKGKVTEVEKTVISKGEEIKATGKRKAAQVADTASKKAKTATDAADSALTKGKRATAKAGKVANAAATAAVTAAAEAMNEDAEDAEDDDDDLIHGFSSTDGGADSSDDESDAEDPAVQEASRKVNVKGLPMVAKDDKSVQARLKKAQKNKNDPKGTLYLGRIPHGFYEEQMREYFSQFGDVTRLRLARNKKTGASKHFAYVELSSLSVAEIVAETMDNYLLMGHILVCKLVPEDKIHPQLWEGANKKFHKVPRARLEKQRNEKPRTSEKQCKANQRVLGKQEARRKKIMEAGIDYEFEGHK